jgi:two-component system, OmpR family, sensor histidine kinase PhoQ
MALVRSLRARVVLWVSVALVVLFAVTIVGLDRAFRQSSERSLAELLEVQGIGLIALAEPATGGELMVPESMIDPQFSVANSGLYGAVYDGGGRILWQSLSLIGRDFPVDELPAPDEQRYLKLDVPGFPPLEALLMGIRWEFGSGRTEPFTIAIAVSREPYEARQFAFRRNLVSWFGGITITMLIVVTGLLTFVLLPLRNLERQVREVEAGERSSLTGKYPSELVPLADNLNALIETERRRLVRYRNTLDDLAHALKTPLAAARSLLSDLHPRVHGEQLGALTHELDRMDQRVSYQLRRARASGSTGFGTEPVAVAPVVADLKLTLDKVYRDKRVACATDVAPGAVFRGDPGDLTEILGNLLDNAYKYCASRVRVAASSNADRLTIAVGDDGRGIGDELASQLFQRGKRADESVPGQGIGLAVVREIVELYRGTLSIARSDLGGAEIRVELARAGAP